MAIMFRKIGAAIIAVVLPCISICCGQPASQPSCQPAGDMSSRPVEKIIRECMAKDAPDKLPGRRLRQQARARQVLELIQDVEKN